MATAANVYSIAVGPVSLVLVGFMPWSWFVIVIYNPFDIWGVHTEINCIVELVQCSENFLYNSYSFFFLFFFSLAVVTAFP